MIDFTLLSVVIPVIIAIAIGAISGNIYLGAAGGTVVLSWVAAKTQNNFIIGAWLLLLVIMALSTGRAFAKALLGDVA